MAGLPQADGSVKLRPVLILKELPGYRDFLVCGISTQLHQEIKGFDAILDGKSNDFKQTGLRQTSLIRLCFLAVLSRSQIPGSIGKINRELHQQLLERLAKYLME
jgi:mRNA interferase MazF